MSFFQIGFGIPFLEVLCDNNQDAKKLQKKGRKS
jgi:hypothetical protein